MLKNKIYLLFSDNTWFSCANEKEVKEKIEHHYFPFPMDKKGDPERSVIIIKDNCNTIIFKKGI